MYLGPSLPVERAKSILDADYRPPVKRGDLAALPEEVDTVAIIDGVLLSDAAVGHREILALLKRGVTVYGGGSMGALRGAELADFGLIGVGKIYQEYASGRIEGDDEVVLAYDPFTQAAISEPLINLRLNAERAVEEGIVTVAEVKAIISGLKSIYYPMRTIDMMLDIVKKTLKSEVAEKFENFIRTGYVDFKQNDAIFVLKVVNDKARFSEKLTCVK